ncbi:MAG TPA: hypothetical protein VN345_03835 [Blastocatellia bacterium]|nr:hypothetical protein [Blastocatellia bacterium]
MAVAVSGHWWFLPLLAFTVTGDHAATIQTLSGLASIVIGLAALAVAVWGVLVAKKQQPVFPPAARVEAAGNRAMAVGGNVNGTLNTGDQNIQAANVVGKIERSGDLVAGHKIVVMTSLNQIPSPHQLPPPPGDFTGREAELRELVQHCAGRRNHIRAEGHGRHRQDRPRAQAWRTSQATVP